jgi:acyl dehydratase
VGKYLLLAKEKSVASLVINRPEVHNVLTGEMYRDLGFLGLDGWRFHKPVYPGDTIRCRIQVISKKAAPSGARGIVTFQREIRNQRDEAVQTGQTSHMFAMRPE